MRPHRFHGGLRLPQHKIAAQAGAIRRLPSPARVRLPLLQHAGVPAECIVDVGQRVRRGETIGRAGEGSGADVHASIAGCVTAIAPAAAPHPSGLPILSVTIEADGSDDAYLREPLDPVRADRDVLLQRLRDCGVVGLGGAAFPTADKLSVARGLLILNGAECEPYIACDDGLLRERAEDVVRGGLALARVAGCERIVLAVEDAMPEALAACGDAVARVASDTVTLTRVPTIYPEGGERQLIRMITGREVSRGGLPRDLGVLVHNVGTAAAAWRAIVHGEALTSRIVSVTGPGVARPGNFDAPLGTSIAELVDAAGGYTRDAARLVVGGPMMGLALPHDDHPVTKTCNAVLVLAADDIRESQPEVPCIRCGECARVCPAQLLPQQIYWQIRAEDWTRTRGFGLFDCIECGCCDVVCPSHIPLVDYFRYAKTELRVRERQARDAAEARLRFEARSARLSREQAEREARRSRAAAPDKVRDAIERARARRAQEAEQSGDPESGPR